MQPTEKAAFKTLLTDAMAFYRRDLSTFALGVWWEACHTFSFEQVAKAITAHAMDPEQGRFAPMPADLVKQLQGTKTDRSLVAWGAVYRAIRSVGAYASVTFDDPAVSLTIHDMGGWPKLCASEINDLPFVQKRFCETFRAYSGREHLPEVLTLQGVHATNNARLECEAKEPVLIRTRPAPMAQLEGRAS
jgi:hypothetical protein